MRTVRGGALLLVLGAGVASGCDSPTASTAADRWSPSERETLRSLWLGSLPPLRPDPTNRFADDPRAVRLGHKLFFDTRLSVNGQVACATCHLPDREFQDGVPLARGVALTTRRTMPIAGTAHLPWLLWDGRKDSQWAQALGPLENPHEHGGSRGLYIHVLARHYEAEYRELFGPLPALGRLPVAAGPVDDPAARAAWERLSRDERDAVSRAFANLGKSIAAYERRIQFAPSRFDRYVAAVLENRTPSPSEALTQDEISGLRLFMGKGSCTDCHGGPILTDGHFHNTGVPVGSGSAADLGRASGAKEVVADEFNCRSRYSDAKPEECRELDFIVTDGADLIRAFKSPSLRNVADRPPYMHAGQLATLREVLEHYNRAPSAPRGRSELRPLGLSQRELHQLEAFLRTLSGPLTADPALLAPPK
jgi:cytochrome c peroxidase